MSLKYLTFQHTEHYMFKIWNTFCFNCVSVIIYCSSFKDDPAVLQGTSCRVWIETSYTVSFSASSLPACCFKSYYFFKLHCPLELASKGKKKKKNLFPSSFTSNMITNVSQAPLFFNKYILLICFCSLQKTSCKDKLLLNVSSTVSL